MKKRTLNILLIEDNPSDADLVEHLLRKSEETRMEVHWRELLATGLLCLTEGHVDLVLLDLSLPDSDGLESLAEVYWQAPHVPVVVLTGLDDEETAIKAVKMGAQAYLVKNDLNLKLLIRSIEHAIERQRLLLELEAMRASFTSLVERSPDGLVVVGRREGDVLYANPAAAHMLGRSQEELAGIAFDLPVEPGATKALDISLPTGAHRSIEIRVSDTEWRNLPAYLVTLRYVA
jgi:DNA-binding NarL/FixJ family response regulator